MAEDTEMERQPVQLLVFKADIFGVAVMVAATYGAVQPHPSR